MDRFLDEEEDYDSGEDDSGEESPGKGKKSGSAKKSRASVSLPYFPTLCNHLVQCSSKNFRITTRKCKCLFIVCVSVWKESTRQRWQHGIIFV